MAEGEEAEDFLDDFKGKKGKGGKTRDEEDARRAAKRALAHVWSKTERMNCERALLSVGFGRCAWVAAAVSVDVGSRAAAGRVSTLLY